MVVVQVVLVRCYTIKIKNISDKNNVDIKYTFSDPMIFTSTFTRILIEVPAFIVSNTEIEL